MWLWYILRVVRHEVGWGPYLCRSQVMLMTTRKFISALVAFYKMDGRNSRYIGEVLERYRGEDAEISREVHLMNWLRIGYVSTLSRGKFWRINPKILMDDKSWKTWKSNKKIVMDEELVQNIVMDEEFVKNFVVDAKIDPKVVMDLSILKVGGCNSLQPGNRKLLQEPNDENEPGLLIGIPTRDSFLMIHYLERHFVSSDQHMKKLMSLREGLHVMMQCCMRQHDACLHPTSWK